MKKIDIEATRASLRAAYEQLAASDLVKDSETEIAVNRRGIDARIEFALWTMNEKEIAKLSGVELAQAIGLLAGGAVAEALVACFGVDNIVHAGPLVMEQIAGQIAGALLGIRPLETKAKVPHVEVGDA